MIEWPGDLILSVVVGSRAYDLETESSDTDRRSVFLTPAAEFWRLEKPPTHRDGPLPEQFSWELERFCGLALAANPTVLEVLWSPIVEHLTPGGEALVSIREAFLSQRAHQTFTGYATAQFRRLDPGRPRWKQAMHMIRLLLSGLHLARAGEPMVRVGEHRERLLAVRAGELSWAEVEAWRAELTAAFETATAQSVLPAEPDVATVESLLIKLRRASL